MLSQNFGLLKETELKAAGFVCMYFKYIYTNTQIKFPSNQFPWYIYELDCGPVTGGDWVVKSTSWHWSNPGAVARREPRTRKGGWRDHAGEEVNKIREGTVTGWDTRPIPGEEPPPSIAPPPNVNKVSLQVCPLSTRGSLPKRD